MLIDVRLENRGDVPVMVLSGDLRVGHRQRLMQILLRLLSDPVVRRVQVDCSGVTHTDLGGLHVLKWLQYIGVHHAKPVRVVHPSRVIRLGRLFVMP